MARKHHCLLLLISLTIITLPPFSNNSQAANQNTETITATYIINNNTTHFWVNNNQWLSKNATYTIQNAFDNLPEQGGKIYLKAGVYPVNGIYITNKKAIDDSPYQQIIFEGEGKQLSTLQLNDNSRGVSSKIEAFPDYVNKAVVWCEPYNIETGIRVTISNIGIDGNRKNQHSEIAGIAIYNDWDSSIENNYVYNCGGHGILSLGSRFLRTAYITGNYVYFTDMAGQEPTTPTRPIECHLSGIYSCRTDVVIRGNNVGWTGYRNESCFLGTGISASFATVENNWVWGNYVGVLIANGQFFSLSNNFIENNVNGVHLWNAHCGTIQNNNIRLYCNPGAGIKIAGNSSFNSIKINKIWVRDSQIAEYGIQESDTADYNNIFSNDIIAGTTKFVSDVTINNVGTILTPISAVGKHTTVTGNSIQPFDAQTIQSTYTSFEPSTQLSIPTEPKATPITASTGTDTLKAEMMPWPALLLITLAAAGGLLTFLRKKK